MRKIFTIAAREYRAMVGTKAFIFSMMMMPLLMFGGIFAMEILSQTGEIKDQRIVVIDQTRELFAKLKLAATQYNRQVDEGDPSSKKPPSLSPESKIKSMSKKKGKDGFGNFSKGQRFILEPWQASEITDQDRFTTV